VIPLVGKFLSVVDVASIEGLRCATITSDGKCATRLCHTRLSVYCIATRFGVRLTATSSSLSFLNLFSFFSLSFAHCCIHPCITTLHDAEAVSTRTTGCIPAFSSKACLHWHPSPVALFVDCNHSSKPNNAYIDTNHTHCVSRCTHLCISIIPSFRNTGMHRRRCRALIRGERPSHHNHDLPVRSPQAFSHNNNIPEIEPTRSAPHLQT
jgi:hypothetical protein